MADGGATIEILEPGLLTTVQDLGRRGFQRYGIPVCGALDAVSLRIANILVGNPEGAAGLEVTFMGPALKFNADAVFAVAGADFDLELDGRAVRTWESFEASAGATLRMGQATDGLRAYIAVAGGIAVPSLMGSRSTDLKGGFGGFEGRALQAGDALPVGHSPHVADWTATGMPSGISRQPTYGQDFTIRVTMGPQDGEFTDSGLNTLLSSEYAVSTQSDRMGYRLEGPAVEHVTGADIVSDGTALGSVQVPGNGQPIILLADRGTTGGYTKVATVIGPDIGLLAQAMPGARVRFAAVTGRTGARGPARTGRPGARNQIGSRHRPRGRHLHNVRRRRGAGAGRRRQADSRNRPASVQNLHPNGDGHHRRAAIRVPVRSGRGVRAQIPFASSAPLS